MFYSDLQGPIAEAGEWRPRNGVCSTLSGGGGPGGDWATALRREQTTMEQALATIYDFFARKSKIIVLTILTYAALC